MEEIEHLAEQFLAGIPAYIWDGETLPVPVEDIADSHAGLLVRDVDDLRCAPGAPELETARRSPACCSPRVGEIWVNAEGPVDGRHDAGSRSPTSSGTGYSTANAGRRSSVARPRSSLRMRRAAAAPTAEEQANAFAAAVLMPARLVREQYVRLGREFFALCDAFGASGAAMGRRLHAVIKPDS